MNKREVVINAKYRYLEDFIRSIPDNWETLGETIAKKHNEIKVVSLLGLDINVKSYHPCFANKFLYVRSCSSEAKQAYYYAHKLQNMSVETPEAIAYVDCYEKGLLKRSFLVSVHLSNYTFTMCNVINQSIQDKELLLRRFTRFTYFSLLRNGVNHLDYSRGNILIKNDGNMHQFSIVDVGRLHLGKIGLRESLRIFLKLWANEKELAVIADEYAKITNQDSQQITDLLICLDKKHKKKAKLRRIYKWKLKKTFR